MATPEGLSGTIWPIHTKPLPDELLTSWMIRLAWAYGIRPVWFWNLVWPRPELPVYGRLNHNPPPDLLRLLADKTATSLERVQRTTLKTFTAIRGVPFFSSALYFCPECLQEDAEPYFRRCWQLPCFSFCGRHSLQLCGRCSNCREELRPEWLHPAGTHSMTQCHHCGADVRSQIDSAWRAVKPVSAVEHLQRRLRHILEPSSPKF